MTLELGFDVVVQHGDDSLRVARFVDGVTVGVGFRYFGGAGLPGCRARFIAPGFFARHSRVLLAGIQRLCFGSLA
ncbi:MAG: hypothetical protein IJI03_12555, partial [Rudaea sp.]|nr:hypothetical protein [Rudaea sp.]